jgi:hypothetical protein
MIPENNIVLAAATFSAVYLCATSLEQLNKNKYNYMHLTFYCNYFIFSFSTGIIISITVHMFKN